jgi:serine-type D-Ala-D-Ala carboxypeptidase
MMGIRFKYPLWFTACLLFCCSLVFAQHSVAKKPVFNSAYDFSMVEGKIRGWVDSGYYNGASIIIAKNNKTIYERYFGNYDTNTVAYIASAGKWLAAATIAAVVEEGKLGWDDKVKKWLPQFTDVKGEATLRQLFSHTAGYPDYQPKGAHTDNYQTLRESVGHIVNLTSDTLPGTRFKYGGLAMQVAGRIAELATDKDWKTIFQEKIARPLGMKLTHFTPVDSIQDGHAPMLGGGARTCLHDYANFLSMISNNGVYNGKRVLSVQSIKEMQSDQVGSAQVLLGEYVEYVRATNRKDIYGLGEWREEVNEKGEAVLISSPSWAGAYPWIDKITGTYGFFLTRISNFKPGFNSFYASPVLPLLVRDILNQSQMPSTVKKGYVNVGDARLYYEETGKGEPVIFIHGHSFDHTEWEPQFYEFGKNYRVIRYDVRGYGRSSMPVEFGTSMHADDLAKLMDALKISKAHLVGLSMGGFIATDFLALHQDRLLSATLASGDVWGGSPGPSVPWTEETIAKRRAEIEAYKKKGVFQNKLEWFNALTIRNGQPIVHIRRPVWDMIYKWDAWQPLHVEPRFLLGTSVIEKLKIQNIQVPVLVLTGEVDAAHRSKILDMIPTAKRSIVKSSGHVSNLENPQDFNQKLLTFLSSVKNK